VRFDLFTIALLTLRDDAPQLDEEEATALQEAHMAYNADLHDAGHLLAAGPLPDERYRGLGIWNVDPERVHVLREQDPAVRAGRLSASALRWMVPGGTIGFSPTRLPRSMAEVASGEIGLDRFTIVLLTLRPDAPAMDESARSALQDAHLAHNSEMHEAGHMLAAGPLHHEELRGLSIWGPEPEQVETLSRADPSVRAGRLAPLVMPWMVPSGAISFSASRFPRSTAEAAYE
jgi:uncharacterized protein